MYTEKDINDLLFLYRDINKEDFCFYYKIEWNKKFWYFASDSYQMILIPYDVNCNIEYQEKTKININNALPLTFNLNLTINSNYFFNIYNNLELIDNEILEDCDSCDGIGHFYHCGHKYDCKQCNETGKINTNIFEKIKNPNYVFNFNNNLISIKWINNIVKVLQKIKCENFSLINNEPFCFFKLDEIYICIISTNENNDSKIINII